MFTRIAAALAFCLLLATPAVAQQFEHNEHFFLPSDSTFAVRVLCPTDGRIFLRAYQTAVPDGFLTPLGFGTSTCINGRTGMSFTVPPGAPTQDITVWVGWDVPAPFASFKLRLDPDCADGPTTTCVLVGTGTEGPPATATGRFTWGGDGDWYRLDENNGQLDEFRLTTARNTCVAVGRIVSILADPANLESELSSYLVVNGGPAGCFYAISATEHPRA